MRLPIPDDWDGETWQSVCIQWPKSTTWDAILSGALSQYKRGWLWDERTGDLLAVIAIGWEIWLRNQAFNPCSGAPCPPCPPCPTPEIIQVTCSGACAPESDEFDMPCLNLASMAKIVDGKLYLKDDCCQWIEIGELYGQQETLPDEPLNPSNDPNILYYACGKAAAGAALIRSVAENFWDERDNYPWEWVSHVENGVGLDLDNGWIMNGVSQALLMSGAGYERGEVMNDDEEEFLKCQLLTRLEDDAAGSTEDDFKFLRDAMASHCGIDVFRRNFWFYVFSAVGWKDLRDRTQLGATQSDADCTCAGGSTNPIDPTGAWNDEWKYFHDFRQSDGGWEASTSDPSTWIAGRGFVAEPSEQGRYCRVRVNHPDSGNATGSITKAWFRFSRGIASVTYGQGMVAEWNFTEWFGASSNADDTEPSSGGVHQWYYQHTPGYHTYTPTVYGIGFDLPCQAAADHLDDNVLIAVAFAGSGESPFQGL